MFTDHKNPWNQPMIKSLSIRNFRCYKFQKLANLGRINVIVGDSAVGKTALLESIYMATAGSPDAVMKFRLFRGMGAEFVVAQKRDVYEQVWKDLFRDFDEKNKIEIALNGSSENTWSIKIYYTGRSVDARSNKNNSQFHSSDDVSTAEIVFEHRDCKKKLQVFKPRFTAAGFEFGGVNRGALLSYYPSNFAAVSPDESAKKLSALRIEGSEEKLLKAFGEVFPDISGITPEIYGSNLQLFCFSPGSNMKRKIPIGYVSGGINKVFNLLIGIASNKNGVVLVDEIENGLYYKTMTRTWNALYQFCKTCNTQLFVSTHSKECIENILPVMKGNEKDFRLLRVERKGNSHEIKCFDGKEFESALLSDYEVR